MKQYEGMYIFPAALNEESLEEAIASACKEINKLGGAIVNTTPMGKRNFSRPMGKKDNGQYVLIRFDLDGENISPLLARYSLQGEVFRVQIISADNTVELPAPSSEEAAAAE